MELKAELDDYKTILIILPPMEYNEMVVDFARQLSGKGVIYISLNKTFSSLKEIFDRKKVDYSKFLFIDGITKSISNPPADKIENCHFLDSRNGMTQVMIFLSKLLDENYDFVVLDSFTNLLIYNNEQEVLKFFSGLAAKVKEKNKHGLFYALASKEKQTAIQESVMFVDRAIDLSR
ncbi:MAG: hypothetical protein V1494_06160 [Candidatus Diapherotrites archaeon]